MHVLSNSGLLHTVHIFLSKKRTKLQIIWNFWSGWCCSEKKM